MALDAVRSARRITRTLLAAQGLASAGSTALFPTIPIVGAQLSGLTSWAGVPAMCYMLGQAGAAYIWGVAMDRFGRRRALTAGMLVGVLGTALAGRAIVVPSLARFLAGVTLIGAAFSALNLSRFVAAEVHPPQARGRAISTVVLGGTFGALFGPFVAAYSAGMALALTPNDLVGPYGAMLLLFALVALVYTVFLRPEPREISRAIGDAAPAVEVPAASLQPTRPIAAILRVPAVQVAIAAMVFGQLVMAMLMVITGLHMRQHDHSLTSISVVISSHVVGMYAFSIISGRLADRWGRGPVILVGAATLIAAALAAPLSPRVLPLAAALFLLGLGWNFCYVAGSTLLADQLSVVERARTQGVNDLLIGLASAAGSLGSGIVFAAVGYAAMALVGAAAALVPLVMAGWWQARLRPAAVAGTGT